MFLGCVPDKVRAFDRTPRVTTLGEIDLTRALGAENVHPKAQCFRSSFNVHSPRNHNTLPFRACERHLGEMHDKIVKLHAVRTFGNWTVSRHGGTIRSSDVFSARGGFLPWGPIDLPPSGPFSCHNLTKGRS